jgi:S-DNA-T family DNA segregation ATPase FtsK/SpoIIIE
MARKKTKAREPESYRALIKWVSAILLIALGIILLLGTFGLAGIAGSAVFGFAFGMIGVGAFLLPALIIFIGISIMLERMIVSPLTAAGVMIIILSTLTLLGILTQNLGGTAGVLAGDAAKQYFGIWGALVLLFALILVGVGIATDVVMLGQALLSIGTKAGTAVASIRLPSRRSESEDESEEVAEGDESSALVSATDLAADAVPEEREPTITHFNRPENMSASGTAIPNFDAEYDAPPISLLGEDKGKPGVGDIKANANIIKRTFQNFGISVEMDEVSVGPTVTRYAIKPAEGVRLQKIVALQQNLELALAAHPVRIEAPIPGKSLWWAWAAYFLLQNGTPARSQSLLALVAILPEPLIT